MSIPYELREVLGTPPTAYVAYTPDSARPPGETLKDQLDAVGMPEADLARCTGFPWGTSRSPPGVADPRWPKAWRSYWTAFRRSPSWDHFLITVFREFPHIRGGSESKQK